jgi:hypothetical protein
VRVLSLRELNRTLLARQLLSERRRRPVVKAVERLVALQAQYAPSPYVALWSRVAGFRKEQLTTNPAIAKAGCFRSTLHVVSRAEFPYIVAAYIESQRGRTEGLGVDIEALRRAVPAGPVSSAELTQLAQRVFGTDDPWTVSFAYRALPFVRTGALGPWPHTKPSPVVLWREPLPDPQEASARVVLQYLAAYGPASREDIVQFTGFRLRQVDPALEGLRTFEDEEGRTLFDVSRAPVASKEGAAPVRFLPAFDSIILAHRDRSRIVPPEYLEAVFNKRNATTKNTFTVDDPFAPLPPRARREVEAEGERLLAFYGS